MAFDLSVLEALSNTIRQTAVARTWSRGVMIARDDGVVGREENEDEIVLSVRVKERPVPYTVVLYPETEEWDCDCDSRLDVCSHTVAAIIALVQNRKAGNTDLPTSSGPEKKIVYKLYKRPKALLLQRLLVEPDESSTILTEPVKQLSSKYRGAVNLTEADIALEPLIRNGQALIDIPEQAKKIMSLMAELEPHRVFFEDQPVTVKKENFLPSGRVTGDKKSILFKIDSSSEAAEVIAPDWIKDGDAIRPMGDVSLTGRNLEKLPIEHTYQYEQFAEFVLEVLPMFSSRFPIEIQTDVLPEVRPKSKPWIDLGVELGDGYVSTTPWITYGRPPAVRIASKRPIYIGGRVPKRDHAEELKLESLLDEKLNLRLGRRVTVQQPEASEFLQKLKKFEAEIGVDSSIEDMPILNPHLQLEEEKFTLHFVDGEDEQEGRRVDAAAVLRAFEAGHDAVPLLGGGWGRIPQDWLRQHGDQIALLLHMRSDNGEVPPFALPALASLSSALDQPPPASFGKLRPLFEGFDALPEASLPSDLNAKLRPYQQRGVDWLQFLQQAGLGALLADDMGLGKTLQTICVLKSRSLVVCPTSVLPNWAAEIAKFRPNLKVCIYHGPRRKMDLEADVVITTYTLLRSDIEELSENWSVAVLDEAQAIKNAASQTARSAFKINSDFRIALSGTPVENRLEELWSQMHFSNPGLLMGQTEFVKRFAKPIELGDASTQTRLRSRIKPFVLRRMKRDVATDLPPRTDMVLYAELEDEERNVYDSIRLATKKSVVEKLAAGSGVMAALEALLRLRQASCHRGLVPGQHAQDSSKVRILMEALDEATVDDHKALVFSQWTGFLDLIEPHLTNAGIDYVRLDGTTKDRGAVVAQFQDKDGPSVMLVSLKAGGTGLNLTAADHVFLLDPWWNPAVEDQAADRAHRIGQERPVMVYRVVAKDTVEEKILALQVKKRALADAAIGGAAAAAQITREDLLSLLEG